jgi:acylphosphatase
VSASTSQARLEAVVRGRVQGVSFRYYAVRTAQSLGLSGWVANRADGTVETVAEGGRGELEEFLSYLRQGPPGARVDGVGISWAAPTGEYDDFRVAYR